MPCDRGRRSPTSRGVCCDTGVIACCTVAACIWSMGNALVAALVRSALDRNVEIRLNTSLVRLVGGNQHVGGRVTGAIIHSPQGDVKSVPRAASYSLPVAASRTTSRASSNCCRTPLPVESTGRRRQELHWRRASRGRRSRRFSIPQSGVTRGTSHRFHWYRVPMSSLGHYPHLLERGETRPDRQSRAMACDSPTKPTPTTDFMTDLLRVCDGKPTVEAAGFCDHAFIRHWGLGAAKPAPLPLRPYLRSGYLKRGRTLAALATECGINASALTVTVARYNSQTAAGVDADFHKGETAYNRIQGDAKHGGPLRAWRQSPVRRSHADRGDPPWHLCSLVSSSNNAGIDSSGAPIGGLYARGNDMNSTAGGHYPTGGITLGPAMTLVIWSLDMPRHAAATLTSVAR